MQTDKLKHFAGCAAIAGAAGYALGPLWGFGVALTVGALKELYDLTSGKGTPDWMDMLANAIGALAGAVVVSFL